MCDVTLHTARQPKIFTDNELHLLVLFHGISYARYESKVLQAGLGVDHCSIDYLTPAVLYFARNWQMVQERTLHTLAGGRKKLYMSDRFEHPTTQQVLLNRRAILSLRFAPNVKFYI